MLAKEDSIKTIYTITTNTRKSGFAAKMDAEARSSAAAARPDFFENPVHQKKIQQVVSIVGGFFKYHKAIYVTHRENRGQCFTSVKVEKPQFPAVSEEKKQQLFYKPLTELGVEMAHSMHSNSWLFKVR